jgi:hypothetical protein
MGCEEQFGTEQCGDLFVAITWWQHGYRYANITAASL